MKPTTYIAKYLELSIYRRYAIKTKTLITRNKYEKIYCKLNIFVSLKE